MATSLPLTTTQLKFADAPQFRPWLTPQQMLELGVFGGAAFAGRHKSKLNKDLIKGLSNSLYHLDFPNYTLNCFGLYAGEPAIHRIPFELRGIDESFFDWYVAFYYNRRHEVDQYRIQQWTMGIKAYAQVINRYVSPNSWTDVTIAPMWKQKLVQIGWDATKNPNQISTD